MLTLDANSPFVDADRFPTGTICEYQVQYLYPLGTRKGASNVICKKPIT